MVEEKASLEIDDWLDDLAEAAPDELNQSDIDSLLGGGEAAPSALPAEETGELDQASIDSLLSGGSPLPPVAVAAEDSGDLDQSDIDSLFSSAKEAEATPAPSGGAELDQSDIDSLFSGQGQATETGAAVQAASADDELNDLFADSLGTAQSVGLASTGTTREESLGQSDNGEFDTDEFDFGDLPDIPDDEPTIGTAQKGGDTDIFSASLPDNVSDFFAETSGKNQREAAAASGGPVGMAESPVLSPPPGGKKKMLAIAACCLLLLAGGGGGYWYLQQSHKAVESAPVPEKTAEAPPQPAAAPPVVPNTPPVAGESRWRMTQANESLAIELTGSDENNDPLTFEIVQPPKFGRLSGEPPQVTYLPNKDFPGEDNFEFRVSDGKQASAPVKVGIMGPEGVKPVAAEAAKDGAPQDASAPCPPTPAKKPQGVFAKNMQLQTLSTQALTIDWKKIWAAANRQPFGPKVSVEILSGPPQQGALRPLDQARHLYEPDRYRAGREIVRYRFKAGGVVSKAGELVINVKAGDKPPTLALRPVAESYRVGESVVLDAGQTRDDSPGAVHYAWQQLAGTPVLLEKHGGEGSTVSFVAPSSFRGEQSERIVIRVTATDVGGQQASRDIAITTISKRHSALWGFDK